MYQYVWFSPNGENVNFGILSKLTFHSLMKEKPLGNKVNKCHQKYQSDYYWCKRGGPGKISRILMIIMHDGFCDYH